MPLPYSVPAGTRLAIGFAAGLLATLIFHQLALTLLWVVGFAPFPPFQMAPTHPFGIPALLSLSFWGGVWGILYAAIDHRFGHGGRYWLAAFAFGALLPTAVALLVVLPLKGRPMGGGWHLPLIVTALLINGAWGLGTGLILRAVTAVRFKRG